MSNSQVWERLSFFGKIKWFGRGFAALCRKDNKWDLLCPSNHTLGLNDGWVSSSSLNAHMFTMGTTRVGKSAFSSVYSHVSSAFRTAAQQHAITSSVSQTVASAHARTSTQNVTQVQSQVAEEPSSWVRSLYNMLQQESLWSLQGRGYAIALNLAVTWLMGSMLTVGIAAFAESGLATDFLAAWSLGLKNQMMVLFERFGALPTWLETINTYWSLILWPWLVGVCFLALFDEVKSVLAFFMKTVFSLACVLPRWACRGLIVFQWQKEQVKQWLDENQHLVLLERASQELKSANPTSPTAL
jgi:hypothetical protein